MKLVEEKQIATKIQISEEIQEIKQNLFDKQESIDNNLKLLGELLLYLRNSKNLKTLLVCRQVNSMVIKNNEVEFVANENVIGEIYNDSEIKKSIIDFLKTKNLSLKQNVSEENYDKETELKKWLGDKLIIN